MGIVLISKSKIDYHKWTKYKKKRASKNIEGALDVQFKSILINYCVHKISGGKNSACQFSSATTFHDGR
jgi:hypothetical protein